jgi:F-type H+-transporting ATPase subunit delta
MASTRAAIRYAKAILEIAESKEWLLVSDMNNRVNYRWKFRIKHFYSKPHFKREVKENALLEVLQTLMA